MTIPQILLRAEISQYLAQISIIKGGVYGGGTPAYLPSLIYDVRKSVERVYTLDPTNSALIKIANYLEAICGAYWGRASFLVNTGGSIPATSNTTFFGAPVSWTYVATADGEYIINLGLPSGAIVWWAQKSIQTLAPTDWNWVYPNITLLNGISLSNEETLNYSYYLPI